MDVPALESSRVSLHAVAEYVVAGPQFAAHGDIRLRIVAGGFASVVGPEVVVDADGLRAASGPWPFAGTARSLAAAAGIEARDLHDVYDVRPALGLDEPLAVDPAAAGEILEAFSRGWAALQRLGADEDPVLWPEHFDIGVSVDEMNYGVSPGDAEIGEPYAYVGPWRPRVGSFWTRRFGAARGMRDLPTADDVAAFFAAGAAHAAADPLADSP